MIRSFRVCNSNGFRRVSRRSMISSHSKPQSLKSLRRFATDAANPQSKPPVDKKRNWAKLIGGAIVIVAAVEAAGWASVYASRGSLTASDESDKKNDTKETTDKQLLQESNEKVDDNSTSTEEEEGTTAAEGEENESEEAAEEAEESNSVVKEEKSSNDNDDDSNSETTPASTDDDNDNAESSTTTASDASSTTPVDERPQRDALQYKYIIVGAGTAGFNAYQAIRELDPDGTILVVTESSERPYARPMLSKPGLWMSDDEDVALTMSYTDSSGKKSSIWYDESVLNDKNCEWKMSTRAHDLDADAKALLIGDDEVVFFENLLLATGGEPRRVRALTPSGMSFDGDDNAAADQASGRVTTYRDAADFRRLNQIARGTQSIGVVGGSLLGCELAAALASSPHFPTLKVVQLIKGQDAMDNLLPPDLAQRVTNELESMGVEIQRNANVDLIDQSNPNSPVTLHTVDKKTTQVDHAVVAVGIRPATKLAQLGGLELDEKNNGVLVNTELAARSGIYAAGDVASYFDETLGRQRVEHIAHAAKSGRQAGRNMTGLRERYTFLPYFYGAVGRFQFQGVGRVDAKLDTVGVWDRAEQQALASGAATPAARGVVYYVDENRIVGVLMCNVDNRLEDAQRIVRRKKLYWDKNILKSLVSIEETKQ